MDRWRSLRPIARSAVLVCCLVGATALSWIAEWPWLAVPSALGVIGIAAVAVGTDSRRPGDWTRTDQI